MYNRSLKELQAMVVAVGITDFGLLEKKEPALAEAYLAAVYQTVQKLLESPAFCKRMEDEERRAAVEDHLELLLFGCRKSGRNKGRRALSALLAVEPGNVNAYLRQSINNAFRTEERKKRPVILPLDDNMAEQEQHPKSSRDDDLHCVEALATVYAVVLAYGLNETTRADAKGLRAACACKDSHMLVRQAEQMFAKKGFEDVHLIPDGTELALFAELSGAKITRLYHKAITLVCGNMHKLQPAA